MTLPLDGRRVIVTRERPGELAELLTQRGAEVIHVPLIAIADPVDGGAELRRELERLGAYDWLVVTSPAGAERVGAAASTTPDVRLAAVGTATAATLRAVAGRPVDVVPGHQRATALAEALLAVARVPARFLIAQADRAAPTLALALRDGGHDVTVVTAYRTVDVRPTDPVMPAADAVVFASGSSIESWAAVFGTARPRCAVGIGPSTANAAAKVGLKLDGVSTDHSLRGLVAMLERCIELAE